MKNISKNTLGKLAIGLGVLIILGNILGKVCCEVWIVGILSCFVGIQYIVYKREIAQLRAENKHLKENSKTSECEDQEG